MTDFLTRIARSALGLVPTANIVSRYEPEQISEAEEPGRFAAPRRSTDASRSRAGESPTLAGAVSAPPAPPSAPAATIARTAAGVPAQPPSLDARESPRSDEPSTVVAGTADALHREDVGEPSRESGEPPHPAVAVANPIESAAMPPLPRAESRRRAPEAQGRDLESPKPPLTAAHIGVIDERSVPQAPLEKSPLALPPTPRARLEERVVREMAAAEPPPSIRVTIGRVEVHTATPPPLPEPPPPATPRLSLHDYLRDHAGRTR